MPSLRDQVDKYYNHINKIQNNNKMQEYSNPSQNHIFTNQTTPTFTQTKPQNISHHRPYSLPHRNPNIQSTPHQALNQREQVTMPKSPPKRKRRIFESYSIQKQSQNIYNVKAPILPQKVTPNQQGNRQPNINKPQENKQMMRQQTPTIIMKIDNCHKNLSFSSQKDYKTETASKSLVLNQQLARKQQQINVLKMQIERHKKCHEIHDQNQSLSKRIAQKLKDTGTSSYYQHKKLHLMKKHMQKPDSYTPIASLTNIPTNQSQENSVTNKGNQALRRGNQTTIRDHQSKNRPNSTFPLKTIVENQSFKTGTQGSRFSHQPHQLKYDNFSDSVESKFKQISVMLSSEKMGSKQKYHEVFQYQTISKRLLQLNKSIEQRANMSFPRKVLDSSRQFSVPKKPSHLSKQQNAGNLSRDMYGKTWYSRNNIISQL